jgi:cellulose synthase/poly-beta-1,6-N-acetylglucosamine synthase-like glycosyltransferase
MSADSPVRIEPDATVSSPKLPKVSIILPVLNEEAQLERCLSAVAEQSYPAIIEVVVADGGSTDETRSLLSKVARVRVVDNPRGIRPAGLNTAIEAARASRRSHRVRARLRRALRRGPRKLGSGHRRRADALRGS